MTSASASWRLMKQLPVPIWLLGAELRCQPAVHHEENYYSLQTSESSTYGTLGWAHKLQIRHLGQLLKSNTAGQVEGHRRRWQGRE
jgi:hypothetical protein